MLNRKLRWTQRGISIEADGRHVQEVVKALGLEKASIVTTPEADEREGPAWKCGTRSGVQADEVEKEPAPLPPEETTAFRAVAARLNYLAADRSDIRVSTVKLCARMANPTEEDLSRLKRVGRFLKGAPRSPVLFEWQAPDVGIEAYSDSDWAGDRETRRSMSGGAVCLGSHLIRSWAKQQAVVATSSAEAELYAGSKCGSEAIGMQTLLSDLGWSRGIAQQQPEWRASSGPGDATGARRGEQHEEARSGRLRG